jgi:hypothetical protein
MGSRFNHRKYAEPFIVQLYSLAEQMIKGLKFAAKPFAQKEGLVKKYW